MSANHQQDLRDEQEKNLSEYLGIKKRKTFVLQIFFLEKKGNKYILTKEINNAIMLGKTHGETGFIRVKVEHDFVIKRKYTHSFLFLQHERERIETVERGENTKKSNRTAY